MAKGSSIPLMHEQEIEIIYSCIFVTNAQGVTDIMGHPVDTERSLSNYGGCVYVPFFPVEDASGVFIIFLSFLFDTSMVSTACSKP